MNNEEKQQKEVIEFDVIKSDLKKVLSAHKRFSLQGKNAECSCLSWIRFVVADEELTLQTTDGIRALNTKLKLIDNFGVSGEFKLSMALASKLSFIKSELDEIRIKKEGENVEFQDFEFNSVQKLKIKPETENFPKIEQVIPKKNNFTVTLSQKLIKDIASMKAPRGEVDLSFDTENNLAIVLVETNSENVSQQAILMPMNKHRDQE